LKAWGVMRQVRKRVIRGGLRTEGSRLGVGVGVPVCRFRVSCFEQENLIRLALAWSATLCAHVRQSQCVRDRTSSLCRRPSLYLLVVTFVQLVWPEPFQRVSSFRAAWYHMNRVRRVIDHRLDVIRLRSVRYFGVTLHPNEPFPQFPPAFTPRVRFVGTGKIRLTSL